MKIQVEFERWAIEDNQKCECKRFVEIKVGVDIFTEFYDCEKKSMCTLLWLNKQINAKMTEAMLKFLASQE